MTAEQLTALDAAAASWLRTPFCAGSEVKGGGVCCSRLAAALYDESGIIPDCPRIDGEVTHAQSHNTSIMLEWFNGPGASLFSEVDADEIQPGDCVLMRLHRVAHHIAVILSGNRAVHVSPSRGVEIIRNLHIYRPRVAAAFRPNG
jgi:cell wall-associated NlpC family hydrolase